jgi:hypothetical protein
MTLFTVNKCCVVGSYSRISNDRYLMLCYKVSRLEHFDTNA